MIDFKIGLRYNKRDEYFVKKDTKIKIKGGICHGNKSNAKNSK